MKAIILGATGSIGRALVERSKRMNMPTIAVARGMRAASVPWRNIDEIEDTDGRVVQWVRCDITKRGNLRSLFASLASNSRPEYVLCNAVGIPPDVDIPLSTYSDDSWERTLSTYLGSARLTFQECCKADVNLKHIVFLSSAIVRFNSTKLPPFNAGHYACAKAALDEFCKWGRREAHEKGFLLSRLSPSAVETPLHKIGGLGVIPSQMVSLERVCDEIVRLWQASCDEDSVLI